MRDFILSDAYRYDARTERERTLRLQRMLRILSDALHESAFNTAETGVYDDRTREAIRALQTAYGLPATGITDYATWDLLRREVERNTPPPPAAVQLFPPASVPIREGEYSDTVLHLQLLLNALRLYYDDIPPLPLSGYYDSTTADAVRTFRRINNLPPEGGADAVFLHRLAEEYNRIVRENP